MNQANKPHGGGAIASSDGLGQLNPGIRKTVEWLIQNGYQTTDSGDGEAHEHECDQDQPYVHMLIAPANLVQETDRLAALLKARGIEVQPMDENCSVPCLEAGYNPAHGAGTLTLWNVKLS